MPAIEIDLTLAGLNPILAGMKAVADQIAAVNTQIERQKRLAQSIRLPPIPTLPVPTPAVPKPAAGVTKAPDQIDGLTRAIETLSRASAPTPTNPATQAMAATPQRPATPTPASRAAAPTPTPASRAAAPTPAKEPEFRRGPTDRMFAAQDQMRRAEQSGSLAVKMDARIELLRATKAFDAAMKQVAQDIQDAAKTMVTADDTTQQLKVKPIPKGRGPAQDLMRAQDELRAAQATNDRARIADARYSLMQKQQSFTRAQDQMRQSLNQQPGQQPARQPAGQTPASRTPRQPRTPAQAIMTAIRSTRFGMGGGQSGMQVMPLIGRTFDALKALGPFGEALGVAAGIVATFGAAAKSAADAVNQFTGAALTGGGTPAETAQLGGIGAALGSSAHDMAELSRNLSQRLATDPMSMVGLGMSNPLGNVPLMGPVDTSKLLLQAMQRLISIQERQGMGRAIQVARQTGLEQLLPFLKLSQRTQQQILGEDATRRAGIMDQPQQRAAMEFSAQLSRLGEALSLLGTKIAGPFMDAITQIIEGFTSIVNWINDHIPKFSTQEQALIDTKIKQLQDIIKEKGPNAPVSLKLNPRDEQFTHTTAIQALQREMNIRKSLLGTDDQKNALDRNTDATDNLARVMSGLARMIVGGGERAQNALPANWRYQDSYNQLDREGYRMGVF
jgi:hypothetical protein